MGLKRLPAHVRAMIPAAERQAPKPKREPSAGAGILARAGVGSMLELSLLHRLQRTGLPQPLTQKTFHPTRKWTLDFQWPAQKLAVEVEGAIYRGGAHTSVTGLKRDIDKSNALALLGWRLLRFHADQIESGEAVRLIAQALTSPTDPHQAADSRERGEDMATKITLTCHDCGDYFEEDIQTFINSEEESPLAPLLCSGCGEDDA